MRFLKNKILKAQEALIRQNSSQCNHSRTRKTNKIVIKVEENGSSLDNINFENDSTESYQKNQDYQIKNLETYSSLKNLSINYGKAILTFAVSTLAIPYLEPLLHQHPHLTFTAFRQFATQNKSKIGGISSLRSLLLVSEADNEKVSACKKVLQGIGEVFIKYFSVNWIMTGRLTHKLIYLKFRAKMLRRVQNPESFTYIREKKPVKGKQSLI